MFDRISARYRLALLREYLRHERRAVAAIRDSAAAVAAFLTTADLRPRALPHALDELEGLFAVQRIALRDTATAAYGAVATLTLGFHEQVSGQHLVSTDLVARLTDQARHAIIAGKTVGSRITLLADSQKNAVRLRLLQAIQRRDDPHALVKTVERYYRGVVRGDAGPAYAARRLVQSEITRFNGLVSGEAASLVRAETGLVTVFSYRTQGDQRVRDTHSANEGTTYVEDDVALRSRHAPLSEAQSYLGEPNCRCWLDVQSYL